MSMDTTRREFLGVPMIVCSPTQENLKLRERFVKEYGIEAAILNRGDRNFPTHQSVLEAVKDLDPRVRLCMGVPRAGPGVIRSIAEAGPRMIDMHLKDQKAAAEGGLTLRRGRGYRPDCGDLQSVADHGLQGLRKPGV